MNNRGFSLIELIFSLAVMALLMSMVIPQFGKIRDKALETSVKAVALSLQTSLETYSGDYQQYPDSSLTAAELSQQLMGEGYMSDVPQNPFTAKGYTASDRGGQIVYESTSSGTGYVLTAYKRDGVTVLGRWTGGTSEG